jgi:hypothetical protein
MPLYGNGHQKIGRKKMKKIAMLTLFAALAAFAWAAK